MRVKRTTGEVETFRTEGKKQFAFMVMDCGALEVTEKTLADSGLIASEQTKRIFASGTWTDVYLNE